MGKGLLLQLVSAGDSRPLCHSVPSQDSLVCPETRSPASSPSTAASPPRTAAQRHWDRLSAWQTHTVAADGSLAGLVRGSGPRDGEACHPPGCPASGSPACGEVCFPLARMLLPWGPGSSSP